MALQGSSWHKTLLRSSEPPTLQVAEESEAKQERSMPVLALMPLGKIKGQHPPLETFGKDVEKRACPL